MTNPDVWGNFARVFYFWDPTIQPAENLLSLQVVLVAAALTEFFASVREFEAFERGITVGAWEAGTR